MQLITGTSIIPLDKGTVLPLVFRSPLFVTPENKIPGSYIFNTPLPAPEGGALRKEFGQAHRVQRHGRATAELPYIITDGILRFAGKCIVTEANADRYEAAFKIDNGDLAGVLNGKTLKDLNLGGDQALSTFYNSRAAMASDQGFSAAQEPPMFEVENPLVFDVEITDVGNSLNLSASTFTSPSTGEYIFNIKMDLIVDFGSPEIYLYKNSVLFKQIQIGNGHNTYNEQIDLITGDVIYFAIHAFSGEDGLQESIYYSILNGSYIEFLENETNLSITVTGDQDTYDYVVFPIYNKEFLSNFPDDAFQLDNLSLKTIYSQYFPVLNYYKDGKFPLFLTGLAEGEYFVCGNLFTPFVYFKTLLVKIAVEAGYTIINNPFDTNDFSNMVLFNAYAENTYASSATTLVPVKATFNLADHVPAMAQNDFIKAISLLTGYMPVVDNNLLTIRFVDLKNKHLISETNPAIPFPGILLPNPLVKVEPEYKGIKFEFKKAGSDKYLENIKELSGKLIYKGEVEYINNLWYTSGNKVNDMYLVTSRNEYYVFQYNPETYSLTWRFYSKKFPLIYTEGEEPYLTITPELCPMLTTRMLDDTLGAPANRTWVIPRTDQPGILEGFPDSLGAEYGLQVLHYKGMSDDSLSQPYPLGSSRYADYTGTLDPFPDLSADGIVNARYKEFLQWLAYKTKPATYKAILTRAQLQQYKPDQIYSGTGFNFLVKELRINLEIDGLSMAEADIYSV